VRTDRGLIECDFGDWTGAQLRSLAKKPEWGQVQQCPSGFRFPGGESFLEMQARISSAIDRLVRRHRGETIVAVSHADPIKAALSTAAGTPLDLFQRLIVSPCSVSAVAFGLAGPHVLTVNSTASLTELAIA
jgi:probable phosphoglycerate mutase